MDASAGRNPAGTSIPDDDVTGDLDTGSARSRSVLGTDLPIVIAREGQVAVAEAARRSRAYAGYTTALTPTMVSARPSVNPGPTTVAPSYVSVSAPMLVPVLINRAYNQQNNTVFHDDSSLLMEAANARHAETVTRLQSENTEQMMNLEVTANSQVAQLRLEHARLENQTRHLEEVAEDNALAGRQAVAS